MKFKLPHYREQLYASPKKLLEVALYFEALSLRYKVEPVVTRVWDPVPGESGVHPAKRAVDFRDQYSVGNDTFHLYTEEQMISILNEMNSKFPRTDGKRVCIHHSFRTGPEHVHIQIPIAWTKEGPKNG